MPLLYGTTVTLRPVTTGDLWRLTEVLEQPQVGRWIPHDPARLLKEFVEGNGVTAFAVEAEAEIIGSTQYYEEPAPSYRHASIEVFLDSGWHGKGLGADAVRTVARHLFFDRGHHRLSVGLRADNDKAIRTYQRVGFRPVGVMRASERDEDGTWRDAMLMELLKRDLQ